jgi:hypothetical protein
MRIVFWRWTLAIVQVAAASAALIYAPYQYRARPHPSYDDTYLLGFRQAWPPPILRISYAINFPAVAAAYPVQFAHWSYFTILHHRETPFIWVSVQDSIFLFGVGSLWCWLGTMLDHRLSRESSVRRSKSLAVTGLTMGCLFAVGVGALAIFYTMLTNADRPYRQIGPFGLIWAVVLLCYFVRWLVVVLRTPTLVNLSA